MLLRSTPVYPLGRPFPLTCVVWELLSPDPDVKYTYMGEFATRQIKGNVDYRQFVSANSKETPFRMLLPLNKHIYTHNKENLSDDQELAKLFVK